jgi:hypothetical protein
MRFLGLTLADRAPIWNFREALTRTIVDDKLDASKNSSRIGGALIQSVVSEAERGHGGMDAGVLRH